jgi:signal transduction histidine kinase
MRNVDEVLSNRKIDLLIYLDQHPTIPFLEDNPLDDFIFSEIDQESFREGMEMYEDILIYEPVDDEYDDYRKLICHVKLHGNYYRLEIQKPHLEAIEIISTIAITLGGLLLILGICFYFLQRIISKRMWRPFYELLSKLKHYRLDQGKLPIFPDSKIDEFQQLNIAMKEMTLKNKEVFESQKQFTENASHEMQTPLSVIQTRLEELIGQTELTTEQATTIEKIITSTQKIKKLNKTLLLLSKIENQQFLMTDKIEVKEIISNSLEYFEEQKDALNLKIETHYGNVRNIFGNKLLTEILIQNLLKNAFLHNIKNGFISIEMSNDYLSISNSGKELEIETEKMFTRFYKKSNNSETWGLGLAIAKKIIETSGWNLELIKKNNVYTFRLTF